MIHMLLQFLVMSVAVFVIARLLPGVRLRSFKTALVVALVYGLLNFVLFRVLIFITFPLIALKWLTLGIFGVVLNAVVLTITDKLIEDFEMRGFGTALLASLLLSLANLAISSVRFFH